MRPRALDLFCGGGGVSEGLLRAGFDVVGVDLDPRRAKAYMRGPGNPDRHERAAVFVQADALKVLDQLARAQRGVFAPMFEESPFRGGFDFIWASPPCQAHSVLRKLCPGKEYPDLIPATRERLIASGIPYCIENVPGAPLGGFLIQLCGTMFGLQTPDGRAELRRHRLFETSWPIALRPACQHGHVDALSVSGHAYEISDKMDRNTRRTLHVTGHGVQDESAHTRQKAKRVITICGDAPGSANTPRKGESRYETRRMFTIDDARHATGIDWMTMKDLSQAIPPAYAEWIGRQALLHLKPGP